MSTAYPAIGRSTPRNTQPRGAHWFGTLAAALIEAVRRVDRWQLARRSSTPTTADDVLNWASQIENSDPGFASDLRGAALRSMDGRAGE